MRTIETKLKMQGANFFLPFNEVCPGNSFKCSSFFGTIPPEPYDVGKDHFVPSIRDIYLSEKNKIDGKFYVTSSIHGTFRRYRGRTTCSKSFANIFATGKTRIEAVNNWIEKYKAKEYNVNNY